MHTVLRPIASRSGGAPLPTARVAVAGATGYTGQELLRLLARHPGVVVTAAMASGATTAVRRLPALVRVWDGVITPLAHETLARETDVVFLALPDAAAAELAPALVDAGVRVVDLSGAFRLRDAGAPFVRLVGSSLPEIKHVAHTNFCDIGWRVDPSGRAVLVSVIDNLLKGASGQAVQNMNVMLGLDERTGLL